MFADAFMTCLHFGLICWKCGPEGDFRQTAVCEESDNAVVRVAARKNKTHCMTNTHVIHSQSMEGLDSMEYSTNPIHARFIRVLYSQKIIVRYFNSVAY